MTPRDRRLRRIYGLSEAQYDKMLARQGGTCALCGRPPKTRRLHVEHNHKTKQVRGLTCHFCNRQIIARNTLQTARRLVAYLDSDFDGRKIPV